MSIHLVDRLGILRNRWRIDRQDIIRNQFDWPILGNLDRIDHIRMLRRLLRIQGVDIFDRIRPLMRKYRVDKIDKEFCSLLLLYRIHKEYKRLLLQW